MMNWFPERHDQRPLSFVALSTWFAVATGLLEIALPIRDRIAGERFQLDPQIVWMAPLTNAVIYGVLALGFALFARWQGRKRAFLPAVAVFSWLALWSLAFFLPRLHRTAVLVLAAGVAIQLARLAMRYEWVFTTLVRVTLRPLVALVMVLALLVNLVPRMDEHKALAALRPAPDGAPNVLILILDTVRARSLSLYGYNRPTTPNLARFAQRAIRFDRALAPAPWTLPSHASMFTGREPFELSTGWLTPLDDSYTTLAEYLRGHGYATAGFVNNLLYTTRESGLARGFIHYEDYPVNAAQAVVQSSIGRVLIDAYEIVGSEKFATHRKSGRRVTDGFLRWMDKSVGDRPFFAFLNYYDAHDPYEPSADFKARFVTREAKSTRPSYRETPEEAQAMRELYEAAIAQLDAEVGRLLGVLEKRGVLDNTIVVIAGDHGEEFGEHGVMGHGNSLYRPALRVPLVIALPGRTAGSTVKDVVSLRDIAATIVGAAGLDHASPFPGYSLVAFADDPRQPRSAVLTSLDSVPRAPSYTPISRGSMRGTSAGPYHYIRNGDGREELYDIRTDSLQLRDLSRDPNSRPALVELREKVDSAMAATARRRGQRSPRHASTLE
jgi:arylsulfatase A-like enzyme